MPFVRIPPESIDKLPALGYQKTGENEEFITFDTKDGEIILQKIDPYIWVDDINDAIQLNARGIEITGSVDPE